MAPKLWKNLPPGVKAASLQQQAFRVTSNNSYFSSCSNSFIVSIYCFFMSVVVSYSLVGLVLSVSFSFK